MYTLDQFSVGLQWAREFWMAFLFGDAPGLIYGAEVFKQSFDSALDQFVALVLFVCWFFFGFAG